MNRVLGLKSAAALTIATAALISAADSEFSGCGRFSTESLVKTGLKHVVDKSVRNPRFAVFHHYRHLQLQGFTIDDGCFRPGFTFT